jgi:hypothetical protein
MQYKRTQRGQHHHDMEHQEFQFPE